MKASSRLDNSRLSCLLLASIGVTLSTGFLAPRALGIAYDFTTFTTDGFQPAGPGIFPPGVWNVTATTATHNANANATILYSPTSALNKKITGTVRPGNDDDIFGFVLGYQPGASFSGTSRKYLLIDWKGLTQAFDFTDPGGGTFHNSTPGGNMPVGLALSEVTGLPTHDELWQHVNLPQNTTGSVTELARGATLGSTAYNRSGGSHQFEITYTSTNVTVFVDGVQQFSVNGSFNDGRFGLYSAFQDPAPLFSNFEVVDIGAKDLRALVNRTTGEVTIENPGTVPVNFDFYQFSSPSHSLNTESWNSLSDQNFQPSGPGAHEQWQEMGGSSTLELGEVRLTSHSTLDASTAHSIGVVYNRGIGGEDLVFRYKEPGGLVKQAQVLYFGAAPPDLDGDFNNDGVVDAADYIVWRNSLGQGEWLLNGNGDGSGTVDTGDYELWKSSYGDTAPAAIATAAQSVPEPTTWAFVLLAALALAGLYRGHRA